MINRKIAVLVTAGLAVEGMASGPPPALATETIEGTVRTLAADTVDQGPSGGAFAGESRDVYQQVVVVGAKSYVLKGRKAPDNARVRVAGTVKGNEVQAATISVLSADPIAFPTSGTTRVLVMMAYWTAPDSMMPAAARDQMFGDSNGWYRDASFNALGPDR